MIDATKLIAVSQPSLPLHNTAVYSFHILLGYGGFQSLNMVNSVSFFFLQIFAVDTESDLFYPLGMSKPIF